jgi:UTP-glucose-1-phosphate uridylyltransferase
MITKFKEKPDIGFASEQLLVSDIPPASFLTVFGLYILGPALLDELAHRSAQVDRVGEVQLTDAMEYLRSKEDFLGLVIDGEKVDIGIPSGYIYGVNLYSKQKTSVGGRYD